jgi:uncharacterized protein YdeI (YjbR/CyaY-like superfamily)
LRELVHECAPGAEETRVKRIETIVARIAEGKDRNWK